MKTKKKKKTLVLIINIECHISPSFSLVLWSLRGDRADDSLKSGNSKRIKMAEKNLEARLI